MTPYATAIIPTHDRVSTLDIAVASVQAQTVRDIEILIVCDGATPEVLASARAIGSKDPRVRVLEFEKGAGAGGVNRDRAVRDFARTERIFYTDDDDLWLPEHVARIGPELDWSDVVDTLPVAATRCGRLALAPVNSGNPRTRALLAADRLKLMYDTHLAHRRSTYCRLGAPWTRGERGNIVREMFAAFAADPSIGWRTLPIATAVSLHGGARASSTDTERRSEIEIWRDQLRAATPEDVTARASPVWQFFSCLNLVPPGPDDSLADYLSALGLSLHRGAGDDALQLPIDATQRHLMATAFALYRREQVEEERLVQVAPLLLDIVKNAVASWPYLRRALSRRSLVQAQAIVARIHPDDDRAAELLSMFKAYQLLWARQPEQAWTLASDLLESTTFFPQEAELLSGDCLLALGRVDEGLEHIRRAVAATHRGSAIGLRLVQALIAAGRPDEAAIALNDVELRVGVVAATRAMRELLAVPRT